MLTEVAMSYIMRVQGLYSNSLYWARVNNNVIMKCSSNHVNIKVFGKKILIKIQLFKYSVLTAKSNRY